MANLTIMVGLSASGKSTVAENLAKKTNAVVISSDKIREELFNNVNDIEHNSQVFGELNKRVKNTLQQGKDVIVDATNLTIKSRKNVLNTARQVKNGGMEVKTIAYIMPKPYEICIKEDSERDRTVGKDVIMSQLKKFQIPFYEEGFDEIIIHKFMNKKVTSQEEFEDLIYGMEGFDQKTKYHKHDLFTHTMKCYNNVAKKVGNENPCLIVASLLHDVGKMSTQNIKEDGSANYLSHENVGTYQLLDILRITGDICNTINTLFYINYHMLPFNWNNEDTLKKYEQLFGTEKFKYLKILHECDKDACGV